VLAGAAPALGSHLAGEEGEAVCDQQTAEGQVALSGSTAAAARLKGGRCPPGSWRTAMRSSRRPARTPPAASQMRAAPDPRILTGGLGPHLTSSGSPAGFPPVSRLPAGFSPFARLPLVSLRPAFSGSSLRPLPRFRFPFGVPPGSLALSNLHDSAAEGRFRRRWSRAARAKVTSPAATTPRLDLAVIRPALQMGNGWARCDVATESPVTSGRERRTPPRPNRPDRRLGGRLSGDLRAVGRCQQSRLQPNGRSASRIFIHRRA
jgi:hypothetical protein